MTTQLPELANVEQLSENVIRVMGGNPSKVGRPALQAQSFVQFGFAN
jgi:hypothetical protein